MYFDILGEIAEIEVVARGRGIRDLSRIQRKFGKGRWRKLKGKATIKLANGNLRYAEIHWYEAEGIGRKRFKIKRFLD